MKLSIRTKQEAKLSANSLVDLIKEVSGFQKMLKEEFGIESESIFKFKGEN